VGRPRAFSRDAALDSAMRVFWRKGFSAASMNDLCDAMGIRSPSLYAAFGSKEALYLEAIAHYAHTVGTSVWSKLGEGETARESFEALLMTNAATLPSSISTPAGCMIALGAVGDEWPVALVDAVKDVRSDLLDQTRARLNKAIENGELPPTTDADALGRFFITVCQGMAVQARDGATEADLKDVAMAAMAAWPRRAGVDQKSMRPASDQADS